jgi:hypothetical protein
MKVETFVRDANEADMSAVTSIYARHVLHGLASFEETSPSLDEMQSRRANVLQLGLPYLVAELEGRIVGYSYAASYRARPWFQSDSSWAAGSTASSCNARSAWAIRPDLKPTSHSLPVRARARSATTAATQGRPA